MEKHTAQVYVATMRVAPDDSVPAKLRRLLAAVGLEGLDLPGKYVAIKTHFGEQGNVSFLKPLYTRTVAQEVRRLSGKPFVTDCSTLYVGMRNDLIDHLECARLNGFNHDSCGCEVVIADGLRGDDEVIVPLPDGSYVQEARIGRAILDADVLISLTHAKGCASSAFGGTIKNLGMGCGSRAGKMVMHSKGMPSVIAEKCTGCRKCLKSCAHDAIDIVEHKAHINENCVGCGHCISYCPQKAVNPAWNRNWEDMQIKMAEYATAVVRKVQALHVAIAIDITPQCDCFAGNDAPMVPNVGMFASLDPVALDQAVGNAINAQPVIAGSALSEKYAAAAAAANPANPASDASSVDSAAGASSGEGEMNHLHAINPASDWTLALAHAESLGIGTRSYALITVE